jgi:hypothetical protein
MSNLADLLPAGGGQNNTDFVADGTISSGAPVILTAAGKAAEVALSSTSLSENVGTEAQFFNGNAEYTAACFDSDTGQVIVTARDATALSYGKAVVGTVSGNTISFGTPTTYLSATTSWQAAVYDSVNQKVVIFYNAAIAPSYVSTGYAIVGTVSGTSISFGSPVTFTTENPAYTSASFDTSSGKIVVAFTAQSGSNYAKSVVGTVSGTSISFGSDVVFRSANTSEFACVYDTNADKTVICYRESSITGAGEGIVGTVSGTSISYGTAVQFDTSPVTEVRGAYDSSTNQIICAYTKTNVKAVLGTVSGTSISFGAIATAPTSGSSAWNSVCYDSNVNKVVVSYAYPDASPYDNGTIATGTVSGTSLTFATPPATFNPTTESEHIASVYDSTNKKAVVFYGENNASAEGLVFQAAGTAQVPNLTSTNLLGIASGAISDTATGTINTWGSRNEAQTGLTIGSDYYVQTDGRIEAGVTSIAFDISSATYTQNFDISSQATIPQAIAFNPTGTKMFIVDIAGQDVNEYALSTGFDVSSASYTQNFSVASQDTAPTGISFNAAGTKMFVCGYTNDNVYEYTLSSGFNLSTASYAQALDVSGQDTLPKDVVFNTDGTKMFVLGGIGEDVNEYTLSAYDISTASFVDSFSVASQESAPDGIAFNTDGTKMFIVGNGDTVFQYNLSSGFDVSTASYASISFSVTSQETGPTGIAFSADGKKMFIVGTQGDDVNEYATTANSFSTDYLIGKAITATQINIKDYTG